MKRTVFLLTLLAAAGCSVSAESPPNPDGDEASAYVMSQEFVTDQLVAPGTAEWPWCSESEGVMIQDLGDGQWRVSSWVDSQNSFGALVRTQYDCVLGTSDGNNWSLVSLETTP